MNDNDWDEVYRLDIDLWIELHELVDAKLRDVPEEIAEAVRQKLTEEFRFWKRQ